MPPTWVVVQYMKSSAGVYSNGILPEVEINETQEPPGGEQLACKTQFISIFSWSCEMWIGSWYLLPVNSRTSKHHYCHYCS